MVKMINEFRQSWQGVSQPSPLLSIAFATFCLILATVVRWAFAQMWPDIFFVPYFPAVLFAAAFGGLRIGVITALVGGALGALVDSGAASFDVARLVVLLIFLLTCAMTIWVVEHYRSMLAEQRRISTGLIEEKQYRKLLVEELQHRLKNKLSTVHAVLHQVLYDQPQVWDQIDSRLRALSTTDDMIARVDGIGCDIRDLLISELGPYDPVRFTLNGEHLFLPAKLAVSLGLIFHELATNASKYGAFSSPRGLLHVSWSFSGDRLTVIWDEIDGPTVEKVGAAGFGTRLLRAALTPFDGKTEISYLKSGVHCVMQCRVPSN